MEIIFQSCLLSPNDYIYIYTRRNDLIEIVDDVVVDDDNGGVGYNFDNNHHLTVGSSVSIISLRCPEIVLFSSGPDS